eukprot:15449614-Alexandrium_andersonii.AAC.1
MALASPRAGFPGQRGLTGGLRGWPRGLILRPGTFLNASARGAREAGHSRARLAIYVRVHAPTLVRATARPDQ